MVKRCLVTGGAGFIGSNLALHLESLGHSVTVVDNFHSAKEENLKGFRGKTVIADVAKPFLSNDEFDWIFHQAAITDPRYGSDEETLEKNEAGFEEVIRIAKRNGAKVIYASTAGLYGNGPVPMHEDQPKDILTAYGRSKLKMDERAETLRQELHLVGLRYFNVFGPREAHKGRPASMIYHLWKTMSEGKRPRLFNYGEQERDFIYVKDIVSANLCGVTGKPGVYNVGTGVGTSFNELVAVLNRKLRTQLEPEYFPMPYDPKTYQSCTIAHTERATRELGFTAQWNFERAVSDYVDWLSSP